MRGLPIKVIYLDSAIGFAGGQQELIRILEEVDRNIVEPIVFSPAISTLRIHCERLGIRWYPLSFASAHIKDQPSLAADLRDLIGSGLAVFYIASKAKKMGASLIHANTFKCGLVGSCASLISRRPLVYHDRILKRHGILDWFVAKVAASIIAVSRAVAKKYPQKSQSKIKLLYGGVRSAGIQGRVDVTRQENIGYLGRISEEKGLDLLIECVPRVVGRFRNTKFLIGGAPFTTDDLSYLDRVRDRMRSLGVEKNVEFLGYLEQTDRFFAAIRVLAVPSRREAMSYAVLEAMSAGVPVVAFRSGGPEEIISHGENGYLVDCFDTIAFSDCLIELLEKPEMAKSMGEKGYDQVIRSFSVGSMVKKLVDHYQELVL